MGALPKHKISTYRKGRRRAVLHAESATPVECPHCHELKRAHFACEKCGRDYREAS